MKKFIMFCVCMLIAVPVFATGFGGVGNIDMSAEYGVQNYDGIQVSQGQKFNADASLTKTKNWDITSSACNFSKGEVECGVVGSVAVDKANYKTVNTFHGTQGAAKMQMTGSTCGGSSVGGLQKIDMGSNFNYSGGSGYTNYSGCQILLSR